MRIIQLGLGREALVDDNDYEQLSSHTWRATSNERGLIWYAIRQVYRKGRSPKKIRMHRAIMRARAWQQIDHVNGDGLDNRRSNLRVATASQNVQNRRKQRALTSRFKGVARMDHRYVSKPWKATIGLNSKQRHLGYFESEEEAAIAYNQAAKEMFGPFAKPNELTESRG